MKRTILSILTLCCTLAALHAQQTVYVCHGYTYDKYDIPSVGDLTLNAAKDSITVLDETFALDKVDSLTFEKPQFPKVTIVYNGSTATVTIPSTYKGVTCSSGTSANVVITSTTTDTEYMYSVSGTSNSGTLKINGVYKLTLELNGVTLTAPSKKAAIDIQCGKRIDVLLAEGTTNNIVDGASGTHKGAFYIKGHAEFKGGGTLNVTGNTKHALCVKEYLELKGSVGTINILKAAGDGIHCGEGTKGDPDNYFQMNGGTVTIKNVGSDCIDSDDFGCIKIKGGTLDLTVDGEDYNAITCDSIFKMTGGTIKMQINGATAKGIRCCWHAYFNGGDIQATVAGAGSRGIRGKRVIKASATTTKNGGNLTFNGTNINMTVTGGTYATDGSEAYGIYSDLTLTQTAGDITIDVQNAQAHDLKGALADNWTGGTRNGKTKE